MTKRNELRRIHAGRYEDGTYGVRRIGANHWQTFVLANEESYDGGWCQSYGRLRDAKADLAAAHAES